MTITEERPATSATDLSRMEWGWRYVKPDFTSSNGYRWPFPGSWAEATGPFKPHKGACPQTVGDGICVARNWSGASSGGYTSPCILVVGWHLDDLLGGEGEKVRVKRAFVLDLIALTSLIGPSANLGSADLRYADLRYADLGSANLRSADLRYADLGSANLRYANLRYADLGYANLRYANLGSANLRYANLRYADLGSANLGSANLRYANLRYADLGSANLRYANLGSASDGTAALGNTGTTLPPGYTLTDSGLIVRGAS